MLSGLYSQNAIVIVIVFILLVLLLLYMANKSYKTHYDTESKPSSDTKPKYNRFNISTWNIVADVGNVNNDAPNLGIYTAQTIASKIPQDQDVIVLQELYEPEDAKTIIKYLKDEYPYYLRPKSTPYEDTRCQVGSVDQLQQLLTCINENNITEFTFGKLRPCYDQIQNLLNKDENCASCAFVQTATKSNELTREAINTGEQPEDLDLNQLIQERCFSQEQRDDLYNTLYKQHSGQLILSRKPLYYINSDKIIPLKTQQGESKDVTELLVETDDPKVVNNIKSFLRKRNVLSFKYDKFNIASFHMPFDLGLDIANQKLQYEIIREVLNNTHYDILVGNFNSEPQYQRKAYNYILDNGFREAQLPDLNKGLVFESRDGLEYGVDEPRGMTFCHNSAHPACSLDELNKNEIMLNLDHIFVNKKLVYETEKLDAFETGRDRVSDHVGIRYMMEYK